MDVTPARLVPGIVSRPCSFTKHNKQATTGTTVGQLPSVTYLVGTRACPQKTRVAGMHYPPPASEFLVQPRFDLQLAGTSHRLGPYTDAMLCEGKVDE